MPPIPPTQLNFHHYIATIVTFNFIYLNLNNYQAITLRSLYSIYVSIIDRSNRKDGRDGNSIGCLTRVGSISSQRL